MENKSLSDLMVEYRARENISQKEFARRCGVSSQTINSIENGLQEPSRLTVAKIKLVMENRMGEKK